MTAVSKRFHGLCSRLGAMPPRTQTTKPQQFASKGRPPFVLEAFGRVSPAADGPWLRHMIGCDGIAHEHGSHTPGVVLQWQWVRPRVRPATKWGAVRGSMQKGSFHTATLALHCKRAASACGRLP